MRRAGRPSALSVLPATLALALLGIAACSGGSSKRLIPPPPSTVALMTTAPDGSDYTGIAISPVDSGKPAAPRVEVLGGDSTFTGVVIGPDGPVGGATVRLERFVGDAVGKLDVITNGDGTWKAPQTSAPTTVPTIPPLPAPGQTLAPITAARPPPTVARPTTGPQGILGGRYRVRAWRTPDFALTTPQILFLEGKQNKQLSLQLSRYTGTSVSSISSPDPPLLDMPLNVTAVVTTLTVDAEGVVRSAPAAGASVSLSVGAGLLLTSGPPATNGQGRATFQLRCQALGSSSLDLTVNSAQTFSLPLRPCVVPPPTTTTLPVTDPTGPSSSVSIPGSTSSSTGRNPPGR